MLNQLLRPIAFGITLLAASTAFADITFFQTTDFGGRRFTTDRPAPNFRDMGFNDRAQSAIVQGESWEICIDSNFGGGCSILTPGRYPTLGQWTNLISSARPTASPIAALPQPIGPLPSSGAVTFFEGENFGGRRFTIDQQLPSFTAARFNDRALSAVVEGTAWEICVDADFRGDCRILAPGRYPMLADLGGRISSARPSYQPRGEQPRERVRSRASATLFSGPNLTGRAFPLGGDGTSRIDGPFNDRASSLRVERGYWIFCSDANFRGECRTFGPGDYAYLPPELDNRISSGRTISNDYPYTTAPNWR